MRCETKKRIRIFANVAESRKKSICQVIKKTIETGPRKKRKNIKYISGNTADNHIGPDITVLV